MTIDDFITYLTSASVAVMLILVSGNASRAAELRTSITVDGNVVRLSDVFDDIGSAGSAGSSGDLAVAQAPAPGMRGRIAVTDLVLPSRQAGIAWRAPQGVTHISVLRSSLSVSTDELRQMIGDRIKRDGYATSFEINLVGRAGTIQVPVNSSPGDIGVTISSYDAHTGKFVASLAIPTGTALNRRVEYRGRVEKISFVPALNRQIAPGETITESDVSWVRLANRRLGKNIIQSRQALVGMTPRRPLAVNRPLRLGDVQSPRLVKKGGLVLVAFRSGNLTITSSARALENGARGDVIRILNTRSNQTLEGVVTGPNKVELSSPDRIAMLGR